MKGALRAALAVSILFSLLVPRASLRAGEQAGLRGVPRDLFGNDSAPSGGGVPQEPPKGKKAEEPPKGAGKVDPLLLPPAELVERFKRDLIFWPGEKGRKAADMIFAGGPETTAPLMEILKGRDYRIKPAVADLLSRFGCKEAFDPVRDLLVHPGLKLKVKFLFKALYRLDPRKTLDVCTGLLTSDHKALRTAAFNFMVVKKGLEAERDVFFGLLASKEGDVRRHAFLLLEKAAAPLEKLNAAALDLVGDKDARLAEEVISYLSLQDDPAVTKGLLALVQSEKDRLFAHAVLILVLREYRLGERDLPGSLRPRFEELLACRDPLLKVAAASGLTALCLRNPDNTDRKSLTARIVPAFMESFLGSLYCRDFSALLDVSALCLKKLTGAPFGRDLTFWRKWWETEGNTYQNEQMLFAVCESDLDRLVVTCVISGGAVPVRFRLAGEGLLGDASFRRSSLTCFVPRSKLRSLVNVLYTNGFFSLAAGGSRAAEGAGTSLAGKRTMSIEVAIDKRKVKLTARMDLAPSRSGKEEAGEGGRIRRIENALLDLFHRNTWQILYTGKDFSSWYGENAPSWRDDSKEARRTELFFESLLGAYNLLSREALLDCLEWLCRRRDLSDHFGVRQWGDLAAPLKGRPAVDAVVRATVQVAVAAVGQRSELGRELLDPVAVFLFTMYGENSLPLISDTLLAMGRIRDALDSANWYERAAAASALTRLDTNALPQLVSLLNDSKRAVRVAALRSLAAIGSLECREVLTGVVEKPKAGAVEELMDALAGTTTPWAFELLKKGAFDESAAVRTAAIGGLAHFRSTDAVGLISSLLGKTAGDPGDLRKAVEALVSAGGPTAREALFRFFGTRAGLEEGPFIAAALADLGETRIVPALLKYLEGGEYSKKIRRSLSLLLVADFPRETSRYRALWEAHPGEPQAFFLRLALGEGGRPIPPASEQGGGGGAYEGVALPVLVKALGDPRWFVRLAALRILEEGAGVSFGKAGRDASTLEMENLRYAWEGWLEVR